MIRGQKTTAVPQKNIEIPIKYHNRFDFEVVDAHSGKVKQKAFAENIVLQSWWNALCSSTPHCNVYMHVGTGTGSQSPTRNSLFTFLSAKISKPVNTTLNEEECWVSHKRVAQWLETDNPNTSWTEVGIASSTTSTSLRTHALIKDMNGNPVTLNKGDTEIVNVYSTIYAYLPQNTDDIKIIYPKNPSNPYNPDSSTDGDLIGWLIGKAGRWPIHRSFYLKGNLLMTNSGDSGSWTGNLASAYNSSGSEVTHTVDPVNKTLTAKIARIPAASYNSPQGIKGIFFGVVTYGGENGTSMWQQGDIQLNLPAPWFPYSAIADETIATGDGVTLDFNTKFPFVLDDGSFVLKKNGDVVDPSLYTVEWNVPNGIDLLPHLKTLDYYSIYFALGMANDSYNVNNYVIVENPYWDKFPIESFNSSNKAKIYTSDNPDGPWTLVVDNATAVPAEHQNKRYWRFRAYYTSTDNAPYVISCASAALTNLKNIQFAPGNAPALGDVITASYHSGVIAKSTDNVFDLSITFTLQEKVD